MYSLEELKNKVGPLELDDYPMYRDYFGDITYSDNDDEFMIIHEGKEVPYEMTLSQAFDDDHCCRVLIDGIYFYFG